MTGRSLASVASGSRYTDGEAWTTVQGQQGHAWCRIDDPVPDPTTGDRDEAFLRLSVLDGHASLPIRAPRRRAARQSCDECSWALESRLQARATGGRR